MVRDRTGNLDVKNNACACTNVLLSGHPNNVKSSRLLALAHRKLDSRQYPFVDSAGM
jgi:GTP1/Obg family GTP-binding protein